MISARGTALQTFVVSSEFRRDLGTSVALPGVVTVLVLLTLARALPLPLPRADADTLLDR